MTLTCNTVWPESKSNFNVKSRGQKSRSKDKVKGQGLCKSFDAFFLALTC